MSTSDQLRATEKPFTKVLTRDHVLRELYEEMRNIFIKSSGRATRHTFPQVTENWPPVRYTLPCTYTIYFHIPWTHQSNAQIDIWTIKNSNVLIVFLYSLLCDSTFLIFCQWYQILDMNIFFNKTSTMQYTNLMTKYLLLQVSIACFFT